MTVKAKVLDAVLTVIRTVLAIAFWPAVFVGFIWFAGLFADDDEQPRVAMTTSASPTPTPEPTKCEAARTVMRTVDEVQSEAFVSPIRYEGGWVDGIPSETFDGSDPDDELYALEREAREYLKQKCR